MFIYASVRCGGQIFSVISRIPRIKKWPIVVSQIRLHPFVVYCAEGIVPSLGEDGFQFVAKLSACKNSGTRGEEFVKLHMVL